MEEGHTGLDGGEVCDRAEVHGLLGAVGAEHGEAGLAAGVDVGVIAKNGQAVRCEGTGRDMDDGGEHFARDLVHVRDHEQQALRGRVGGGQRACGETAVDSAGGTAFSLHFDDVDRFAEDVFLPCRGPFVGVFRHGRGRSDGVNGGDFRERIGNVRGGVVAVHGFQLSCHCVIS